MAKLEQYMQGRTEGMELALRQRIKGLRSWKKKSSFGRRQVSA